MLHTPFQSQFACIFVRFQKKSNIYTHTLKLTNRRRLPTTYTLPFLGFRPIFRRKLLQGGYHPGHALATRTSTTPKASWQPPLHGTATLYVHHHTATLAARCPFLLNLHVFLHDFYIISIGQLISIFFLFYIYIYIIPTLYIFSQYVLVY